MTSPAKIKLRLMSYSREETLPRIATTVMIDARITVAPDPTIIAKAITNATPKKYFKNLGRNASKEKTATTIIVMLYPERTTT